MKQVCKWHRYWNIHKYCKSMRRTWDFVPRNIQLFSYFVVFLITSGCQRMVSRMEENNRKKSRNGIIASTKKNLTPQQELKQNFVEPSENSFFVRKKTEVSHITPNLEEVSDPPPKPKLPELIKIYQSNRNLFLQSKKEEAHFLPEELQELKKLRKEDFNTFLPFYEQLSRILEDKGNSNMNEELNVWIENFTQENVKSYQKYCLTLPSKKNYLKLLKEYTNGCQQLEELFKKASLEEKKSALHQMKLPPKVKKAPIITQDKQRSSLKENILAFLKYVFFGSTKIS